MAKDPPNSLRFPTADIERQLERILNNSRFLVADQLSRFLLFVVDETLAGRQKQIKQYTVGVRALGRDASFKPQADPIVRMQAHRLRRALRRYFENEGTNDPIRIEIPKGRYIPVFLPNRNLSRFPEAPAEIVTPAASTGDFPSRPSIAVLPLVYLGNGEDDAYFASGLTEELVISLTYFPEFLVLGPLNREKIRKQYLGPRGIGQQYKVRFLLDGTVRKKENTLKVTAKLTDTVSGQHLWGRTYNHDLNLTSVMEIENEIVSQVTSTVADNFGIIPRTLTKESLDRGADTLTDYEAILRFYHYSIVVTEASYVEAVNALEYAIEKNSYNAMTAALLGDLIASAYHTGLDDSESLLDRAEYLGRRAVALDPNCQAAHYTMALVYFLRMQREPCLEEIEKTLQLNPNNANYLAACAVQLAMLGEWNRGLEYSNKAMHLNPHHPGWYHFVPFMNCFRQGSFDSALNEAQRFNTVGFFMDPLLRVAALGQFGRKEEADKAVDELIALVPDFRNRGRSLIRRVVFLEENVELLLEGLGKAGLELEPVGS